MAELKQLATSTWKIIPQFQSRSIAATLKFYTEYLGFVLGGVSPDDVEISEARFCSVFAGKKADANIYFFRCQAEEEFQPRAAHIALGTIQLDEYYEKLKEGGKVKIVAEIEDTAWGYREFAVEDCDKNRLTFFRFLKGGNPGSE
jgi:uncharacterized glyoxalase superfamily protein PhnB